MDKINKLNDTFFMVLKSDDGLNYHTNNNPSEFTIQYDKPFELLRNMEVGLLELTLPEEFTFNNIPKSNIYLVIEEMGKKKFYAGKLNITSKFVNTVDEFFDYIKENIKMDIKIFKLMLEKVFYDRNKYKTIKYITNELPKIELINNKIQMTKGSSVLNLQEISDDTWTKKYFQVYYEFDDKLKSIIKFPKIDYNQLKYESLSEIYINQFYNYIISLDIIKHSHHGSNKSNILRIIPKEYIKKNKNCINFDPILFVPVNKHHFDSISVTIKDNNNNNINFINGTTTLILLFRPLEHI